MNVVFDTNVLISALFWNGASRRAIDLAVHQHVRSATSIGILQELQSVLSEDFQVPPDKLKDILRDILSYSHPVKVKPLRAKIRDLDDLKVIACAVAAKADYLVTGDKDLLVLHQFGSIRIVTPAEFLKISARNRDPGALGF